VEGYQPTQASVGKLTCLPTGKKSKASPISEGFLIWRSAEHKTEDFKTKQENVYKVQENAYKS
jgi:hypothetical protein